jgi:hypothetical protein
MSTCKSKPWTPVPAPGIKHAVGAKARRRRETQHALTEIAAQSAARRRNDRAPSLEHVIIPTASLNPASRQVRHRDAAQHARIEASLDRFGICRPILIDTNRTIVEGHGIWEAAKAKGIEEIPCLVIDHLSPNELRLLRIALNRLSETGAWDAEELRLEFEELTVLGEDLVVTGFEMTEIDTLLLEDDEDGGAEPEQLPAAVLVAVSQLGDVWILGDHRLTQGDACDPGVYARLMGEREIATLVLTDEPFNVPNLGHVTGNSGHREFAMANGEMSREQFGTFNGAWMSAAMAHLVDGGLLATFIDWRSVDLVIGCGLCCDSEICEVNLLSRARYSESTDLLEVRDFVDPFE